MTGIDVVNTVVKHIEEQIKKNKTIYIDLGNPEYIHRLNEDAEILEFVKSIMPWRDKLDVQKKND